MAQKSFVLHYDLLEKISHAAHLNDVTILKNVSNLMRLLCIISVQQHTYSGIWNN